MKEVSEETQQGAEAPIELDAKELAKELEVLKQKYAKLESDNIRKESALNKHVATIKELDKQKAEETGNFKQLYETEAQEKARLQAESTALAEKLALIEEEREQVRLSKLKQLPKDLQETFANLSTAQIETLLEKLTTQRNSQGLINNQPSEPNPFEGNPLFDKVAREKQIKGINNFTIR